MSDFNAESLPSVIANLFRLNHHTVEGPVKINGAEIDLVATPVGNPFAAKVYIEATIEYVNTTKYGKDLTKLTMVREMDPAATCLIVSSKGFTLDVRERALHSRIETLTYQELFKRFEKFQPYVELMTGDSVKGAELRTLASVYEPPKFEDSHGGHDALSWMDEWLKAPDGSNSWLIVVGEYGTGKSALTRMLQKRWLDEYSKDPIAPIPVRIELGDFTKQFDASGLLHHFLDNNGLGHVPIEFFWSLIRSGRVVLILDGYDEMAQYLTQRERRSTLQALAELSSDGARGMLTSRPNYFSETEELALFDHLYRQITLRSRFVAAAGDEIERRESEVDSLIQRSILDRFERSLMDLSPMQSRALVQKILLGKPEAADTVIRVLDRVFRSTGEGTEIALSGKPVIISYLIEVAGTLQAGTAERLSEWDVYTLIVDQLALRDVEQTTRVRVEERRTFLQSLAVRLTKSGETQVDEQQFRELIERVFRNQLRRFSGSQRTTEVDGLFDDLRRSGTLTRGNDRAGTGWRFSHNSLREFLAAEEMVDDLEQGRPLVIDPPVSDAMRAFVASRASEVDALVNSLIRAWPDVHSNPAVGSYLTLMWDSIPSGLNHDSPLERVAGSPPRAERVHLVSLEFSSNAVPRDYRRAAFRECTVLDVSFRAADLAGADFDGSLLEAVSFEDANLSEASFEAAVLVDVSVAGATLTDANFSGVNDDISLILDGRAGRERIEGQRAIGYLAYCGAKVDSVDPYYLWINHPRFSIVEKVASKLVGGGLRQRRGLEQRGAAALDPNFARELVKKLQSLGYVQTPLGRPELVEITPQGRAALGLIQSGRGLPDEIAAFLSTS